MWHICYVTRVSREAAVVRHLDIQSLAYVFLCVFVRVRISAKQSVNTHIDITAAFDNSFKIYVRRTCRRHEKKIYDRWRAAFLGFLSFFLSLPPSLSLLIREKKHHVIIFINNYQKQTPRRNTGLAVAALKQQSCLCGQTHTHRWATAVQQHSLHTLHSQDMCTCLYKLSHCLSAE